MSVPLRCLVAIVALAMAAFSRANTIPALQAAPIPAVQLLDEDSRPTSLRAMLKQSGSGPVILLPIFTRCTASCPVLTRKLEVALSRIDPAKSYRVAVFSFDPLETGESLRLYRLNQNIPATWNIVRSNETEIRSFFGFFHYLVMNQEGKLVHPSEIFVLDQDLNWRWTLLGEDWTGREVASALEMTRSPGFSSWMKANPERLAWAGFATLILSVGVAVVWMIRRNPVAHPRVMP